MTGERPRILQVLVVEGRYDAAALTNAVDALILTTDGFGIFKDKETQSLLKELGRQRGVIVLTDPDTAGFRIRRFLTDLVGADRVAQAYIPAVPGKESRKAAPSKEGKLGVEGVPAEVLLQALRDAGVSEADAAEAQGPQCTAADFVALGLSGGPNSAALRRDLLRALGLPENLSTKMLLRWIDSPEKKQRFLSALKKIQGGA